MKMKSLAAVVLALASFPAVADEVTVAVAANFTDATRQIVPAFEKATGHTAKVSYGSTGKLYVQIENGAPFDIFLAADSKRPIRLEADMRTVPGSRFTYARGKLMLWSPEATRVDSQGVVLNVGGFERLAIANPKTAPYGLAAQQVLEALDLWKPMQPRLVRGDSIAQAFQFVATGNAPLGFVAKSQVMALPEKQRGSSWDIGQELYQPIEQQAVLLQRGADNKAARAFIEFLKGDAAREIIERFGYGVEER